MLCTSRRLAHASSRRAYSTLHPYPFHNLRALPFKSSPQAAQNLLAPFASSVVGKGTVESLLCWFFPNSGFSPIRPVRLQAVYFPGWILDAELQGQVSIKGHDRQASVQIDHAYIPGSDYKVLSAATLTPYHLHSTESVPFSENLQRQHGIDIACIPYNISPFSILDIAGHLSPPEAIIEPGFRLTPSTLKANLFAAYPVLFPLYLAQYEIETRSGKRLHTFAIEASESLPAVWAEPFPDGYESMGRMYNTIRSFLNLPDQPSHSVFNMGYPKSFVDTVGFSLAPHKTLGQSLCDYLETAIRLPGAATTLAAASAHDLGNLANDRRIREFTPNEYNPVSEWLRLGSEIAMIERMLEALSKTRDAGNTFVKDNAVNQQSQTLLNKSIDSLFDNLKTLQADRLKTKPHWAKTQEELEQDGKSSG